ncbi:hypothetical protein [Vibrio phage 29Fa.3]|nr:hypothetical protein [Vibrio phage 29Fa.3]
MEARYYPHLRKTTNYHHNTWARLKSASESRLLHNNLLLYLYYQITTKTPLNNVYTP